MRTFVDSMFTIETRWERREGAIGGRNCTIGQPEGRKTSLTNRLEIICKHLFWCWESKKAKKKEGRKEERK